MAPPQDSPDTITLRVKVAPGHVASGAEEFTLGSDIPVALRVGQIRERIQEALPTHPAPERQRILYAGRALVDNDVTLAEALNIRREPSQHEYVVHLLVKGDGRAQVPPHRPVSAGSHTTMTPTAVPGQQAAQVPATPQGHQDPAGLQQVALQHQATLAQLQQMHARILSETPILQQRVMQQVGASAVPNAPFGVNAFPPHGWPGQPNVAATGLPRPAQQGHGQEGGQDTGSSTHNRDVLLGQQTDGAQAQAQSNVQHRPRNGTQHAHIQGFLPSGERITIHQQTTTFPQGGMPPPHFHHGLRPMQPTNGLNMPGHPPSTAISALDRARENIASMRQILQELRENNVPATEEQQARIARLEEQTQALNSYIDPLHLGTVNNGPVRRASPASGVQAMQDRQSPFGQPSWQQRTQQMRQAQQPVVNSTPSTGEVTCYLLSSPTGPRALLYSPEHGVYTGSLPVQYTSDGTGVRPTPTSVTFDGSANPPAPDQGQPNAGIVPAQAQPAAQAAAEPDPMGPLGPFLGHFWLTLRILIFSYFVLGSNMGWRRPVALMAIGLGFWLIRIGVQGDGPIRRWWEGVVNHGQQPRPAQAGQEGQQPAGAPAQAGQMPTPEQLAQRLIDEANRARGNARNGRVQWLRERLRPVERSVALLVASLWPGVGEAYVRAREEEDRRRAEEEVAARRAEEEERKKREDEEKAKVEDGGEPKQDASVTASASGAVEGASNGSEKDAAAQQALPA